MLLDKQPLWVQNQLNGKSIQENYKAVKEQIHE